MSQKRRTHVSIYISRILRHHPEELELTMDHKGWVRVDELIEKMNPIGPYRITLDELRFIVKSDEKGRYRLSESGHIKACQGHSLPWVEPELEVIPPPRFLYHGTNTEALEGILAEGAILRMQRQRHSERRNGGRDSKLYGVQHKITCSPGAHSLLSAPRSSSGNHD